MSRLIIVVVLVFSAFPACGGLGDGTRDSCSGSFTGTFEGDASGTITATMNFAGEFRATLRRTGENSDLMATAMIQEDGMLDFDPGAFRLMGSIDFDSCEGSGPWESSALGEGTWSIAKPY